MKYEGKKNHSRKNITEKIVRSFIILLWFVSSIFFMLFWILLRLMMSYGSVRSSDSKLTAEDLTFLKLIGFLHILVCCKLHIGKSFGSVRLLIFRNENLHNIRKPFLFKKRFDIFLFAFEWKIFQEYGFVLFLFTILMIIATAESNDGSVSYFDFLFLQFWENFISDLLRVELNVSRFFIAFLLTSDFFYEVL